MNHEKINYMDAARRQLVEAIRMFFEKRDSISIHTIACASQQILLDLRDTQNVKSPIYDFEYICPKMRKKYIDGIREAQTFFKHASLGPDATIDFNTETTELILFDSCILYGNLGMDNISELEDIMESEEITRYLVWFKINNHEYID